MGKETITELEVLFTANTAQVDKAAKDVQDRAQKIEKKPVKQKVEGDAKDALDAMDRVEAEAKKIVSAKTVATVDANIDRAEKSLTSVQDRLDYLRSVEGTMEVTADIKRAEAALKQIERRRDALVAARQTMVVDADTSPAKAELDDLGDEAEKGLEKSGGSGGKAFMGGLLGGLLSTPIAGALVGLGQDLVDGLMSGLQVEVRSDRLVAQTGLDPVTVGKLARAAGEAYASNWGESLEANMDTARVALQQGLLDPAATARDSQAVITSLSGIADIMGQEIPRTSQAAATLIRSGLAKDSAAAFDIIVKGYQAGNDKAEDWLDTLIEYPAVLKRLGITGAEATGLINQGLTAGARNSDFVADALKEFQIRATDASTASAEGYRLIGLSAQDMTAQIARGGEGARAGLDLVLDKLRETEDPVVRNAAAVALFGTKAEDLGEALFALDVTTAVGKLGQVEGAAKSALDALTDNAASDIASAQRNIQVATDGIAGALAAAFNPQIEDFATYVSTNREQVMRFLLEIANGGLDAGRAIVDGLASGSESIGSFISGPIADLLDAIGDVVLGIDAASPGDQGGQAFRAWADEAVAGLRTVKDDADAVAWAMRENLIANGIDPAQQRLNDFALPLVAQAALHDATTALAADLDGVGYAADGSRVQLELLDGALNTGTQSGYLLDQQLRAVVAGLDAQARAGVEAGDAQGDLTARYDEGREALIRQVEAMGLTRGEAEALVDAYGAMPGKVETIIKASTAEAQRDVDTFVSRNAGRTVDIRVVSNGNLTPYVQAVPRAAGAVDVRPMAAGAVLGAPLSPVAQMVRPGMLRVVGDRMDVDEAFIPLDGSPRSWAIMREALRRMPGGMADGGVTGAPVSGGGGPLVQVNVERVIEGTPRDVGDELAWAMTKAGVTR